MKKILGLLGTILVTGNAIPSVIATASNKKHNLQTSNLKNLIRNKRADDNFNKSNNTYNEIGEITEEGLLWGRNHKCYFIKLTPIFWLEIINLYNKYFEEKFSKIIEERIKKEFKDFFYMSYSRYKNDDGKRILMHHWSSNNLGKMIYKNWNNINNKWEESNKTKRIRILFNFYSEQLPPNNNRWMEIKYIEQDINWYHNYISANIEDNNEDERRYDYNNYNDNDKVSRLRRDFKGFNTDSIDLGIIDDNENKTILDSLQKQNPNLDISQLEIINKEDYSQLKKRASAQIKFKIENKSDKYPKIFLKPKLVFITRIKIQEISNQIENANLFQQWNSNFNQWKNEKIRQITKDIPKYGEDERRQALKRTWIGELLIQINTNLLSLNHILETIDNRFKIEELNNTIKQEVEKIKENINNLRNEINEIRGEIWKIKNPNDYDKKMNSLLFTFITRISKYITFYYFPTIWTSILIFDSLKEIFSLMTKNQQKTLPTKNEKSTPDIYNNLDNKNHNFDFPFQKKVNNYIISLLNNINQYDVPVNIINQYDVPVNIINQYDVPADGSCLFWSVVTAYLLPVHNDNEEFGVRFIQLFGTDNIKNWRYIQRLLQQFDLENNSTSQLWYQDQTAQNLITNVFRNRLVDYIRDNLDNHTQSNVNNNQGESFRRAIELSENEININSYLERMRGINEWGGQIEILAIGRMLNTNINETNIRIFTANNEQDTNTIQIFHVYGNHYNFSLENQNTTETDTINQPASNIPNNNKKGGGQSQSGNFDKILNKTITTNIKNLEITTNKVINKYNSLSKEEKQQKLNEINQHYQNLSENDKKDFKDKLTVIGTSAIGAKISVVGTKITVSGSASSTVVSTGEAIEMTPLLSEGLTAAETLSVAEGTAVVATEGAVIGAEAGTAAALAPETLGLSLVIGGLAIAGTAIIWWLSSHDINTQAVKHESHNQYNEIEKYYKFLSHDQLKLDINISEWNKIKQIYQENSNNYQEFKNKIKSEITNFHKEDHSGWGGSITDDDINTLINILYNHFQEINNHFSSNLTNHGWKIVTNTIGSYFIIEEE